jgi:hypothetical protein
MFSMLKSASFIGGGHGKASNYAFCFYPIFLHQTQYSGFNRDSQTPDGCSEVDIQISGSLKGFNPTVGSIQVKIACKYFLL